MKITQCDMILRHLRDHGSITSFEAFTEYGILRLASRINDLKRSGHNIVSDTATGQNRYGEKIRYSIYRLSSDKDGD